jgi:lactoylglutathione lyase
VDDVTSAVEQLAARGCTVVVAPLDIRIGKCAVVTDPFGNTVSILDMTKGPLPEGFGLAAESAGHVGDG